MFDTCTKLVRKPIFRHQARFFFPVFMLLVSLFPLSAQETILESYERIFIRSSLNTKVNVLADAATDEAADEFYGALCERALRFVLDNGALFRDDPDMLSITLTAVKGAGEYRYRQAAKTMWQVFLRFPENAVRYEILRTLPLLDAPELAGGLNEFLAEQNNRYASGLGLDSELLSALFAALDAVGDHSSYPVLFASTLLYQGDIEAEARRAIYGIDGNLSAFCLSVITANPPEEKLEALKLAMGFKGISTEDQGDLSEAALEAALTLSSAGRERLKDLSRIPLQFIRESGRIRALPLVLKYYNLSLAAFRSDPSRSTELVSVIDCLSALKDVEAARVLSLQLGLYNSRAVSLSVEEREIVLALIRGLGTLGYKASYDSLHYAASLPYPEETKEAAREALVKLQW